MPFRTKEGKSQHFLALGTCVVEGEDTSARGRVILLDIYKATIVHASADSSAGAGEGQAEGDSETGASGAAAGASASASASASDKNSDNAPTKTTQLRAQTFLTRKEKGPVTAMCAFDNAKTGERMLGIVPGVQREAIVATNQ